MDWNKIWDVFRFVCSKEKWMAEIKKNDRNFWRYLPSACRELKIKLNEDERTEVYLKICRKLREES